jgi:hypothetical protein
MTRSYFPVNGKQCDPIGDFFLPEFRSSPPGALRRARFSLLYSLSASAGQRQVDLSGMT